MVDEDFSLQLSCGTLEIGRLQEKYAEELASLCIPGSTWFVFSILTSLEDSVIK